MRRNAKDVQDRLILLSHKMGLTLYVEYSKITNQYWLNDGINKVTKRLPLYHLLEHLDFMLYMADCLAKVSTERKSANGS